MTRCWPYKYDWNKNLLNDHFRATHTHTQTPMSKHFWLIYWHHTTSFDWQVTILLVKKSFLFVVKNSFFSLSSIIVWQFWLIICNFFLQWPIWMSLFVSNQIQIDCIDKSIPHTYTKQIINLIKPSLFCSCFFIEEKKNPKVQQHEIFSFHSLLSNDDQDWFNSVQYY